GVRDLVRDRGEERAERREPLGVSELLLEDLLGRAVADDADGALRAPVARAEDARRHVEEDLLVRLLERDHRRLRLALRERLDEELEERSEDELLQAHARRRVGGGRRVVVLAEDAGRLRVAV